MEETKLVNEEEKDEDFFCDACDDFPFFDCTESSSNDDVPSSSSSATGLNSDPYPGISSRVNLRRRRRASGADSSEDSNHDKSSVTFENGHLDFEVDKIEFSPGINGVKEERPEENKLDFSLESKHHENGMPVEDDVKSSAIIDSSITNQNDDSVEDKAYLEEKSDIEVDSKRVEEIHAVNDIVFRRNSDYVGDNTQIAGNRDENTSFLLMLAGFVIKAILFKLRITVYAFMWPLWIIYSSYKILTDPFYVVRQIRKFFIRRVLGIWGYGSGLISDYLSEFLEEHKPFLKLGLKFGWGLLWATYVCVVLVCFLVAAFVVGGILMKVLVEEPIRMREKLNFDYTENSPVAYVPVVPGSKCGFGSIGKLLDAKFGVVDGLPPKHKLQVTVSLTLPESDYNKNLGIFQVRVDFLGAEGELLSTLRRPCMLRFSSEPIRLLTTLFKMAPLLTGYSLESQDVNVKLRSVAQTGDTPITCLRIMIEERAQLKPSGAGIPEIYSASMSLESIQPFLKRIIWLWRRTLFVWISMMIFMVELLFALMCCSSIMLPRVRFGLVNSAGNATR